MKILSLLLLALPASLLHAADWIKISSPHFDLLTQNTEAEARQTLDIFERTRDFFLRIRTIPQTSQAPVTLVGFATAREYRPYTRKEFTPAYFLGGNQRDYIVMGELGENRTRAAIHEYVHLLVRHSGEALPAWLNEGLADVYSTLQVRNGKNVVGAIPKDRTYSLTTQRWIRLSDLVAAPYNSSSLDEANRAGIFYGESWLLAHMLMLGEPYAAKFPQFVQHIAKNRNAQAAFSDVYNKSLADIQAAMNAYLRQESLGAAAYEGTPSAALESGPAQPAPSLELGVTLARLSIYTGRIPEATQSLDQLAAANPDNPEIDLARGDIAMSQGDFPAAARHFRLALEHGDDRWSTHWSYARTVDPRNQTVQDRLNSLRKAVSGNPSLGDAHAFLGMDLATLGDIDGARDELERARTLPLSDGVAQRIEQALRALARAEQEPLPAEDDDVAPPRPVLRRNPQPAPAK